MIYHQADDNIRYVFASIIVCGPMLILLLGAILHELRK